MIEANLALVLTGGGARAAYQVGFLRHVVSRYPDFAPGILTGVSAGGTIATCLASRPGSFAESVARLEELWRGLRIDDVFRVDPGILHRASRGGASASCRPGAPGTPRARSLLDTASLRELLTRTLAPDADGEIPGIGRNLDTGALRAIALTASSGRDDDHRSLERGGRVDHLQRQGAQVNASSGCYLVVSIDRKSGRHRRSTTAAASRSMIRPTSICSSLNPSSAFPKR